MEIVRPQKKPPSNDAVSTLPLYRSAPSLEVRLDDFELYAIDRLRVLKGISDGLSRGKKPEEMEKLVDELWRANMEHPQSQEFGNKDIISHFVLRLGGPEEMVSFQNDCSFSPRFRLQTPEAQRALMAEFDLPYKAVSTAEFEVPFEEVPELVASCRVFVHKGYAYVAMNQVVSFLVIQFRSLLPKALTLTNRKLTSTIKEQEKDRLTPIVEALCSSYLGPDYSRPKEFAEVSIKDIDQVAKSSFPLAFATCLKKEDHHLKHGGRMQLGLFLKSVGLKLDDALSFWKAEFSQKVGAEKFDKEYAYNIWHNYGREGKRTTMQYLSSLDLWHQSPRSKKPVPSEYEENFRAALCRMGVTSGAVDDVMDKVRNKHYQLTCTLTFKAIHASSCDTGINHPNQYFSDGQRILKSKGPHLSIIKDEFQLTALCRQNHVEPFVSIKASGTRAADGLD